MAAIVLSFRGETYRIPEERAFEIGERIEDIVTLAEILSWGNAPRFFKIARCFAEMLRFAGLKVTDREVHTEIMDQLKATGADGEVLAVRALEALVAVLMDGAPVAEGDAPAKKATAS